MQYHDFVDHVRGKIKLPQTVEECLAEAERLGWQVVSDDDNFFHELVSDNPNYAKFEMLLPARGEQCYAEKHSFYIRIATELMYNCFHKPSNATKIKAVGLIKSLYISGTLNAAMIHRSEQRILNILASYGFVDKGTPDLNDSRLVCYSLVSKQAQLNIGLIWLFPELIDLFD